MSFSSVTLALIGGIFSVAYGCHPYFTCERLRDNTCVEGGCNDGGCCGCYDGYLGYDCSVSELRTVAATCTPPCTNGGICVDNGPGPDTCLCPSTHYGPVCEFDALQAMCSVANKLIVNVNMPSNGEMIAYVKGKREDCPVDVIDPDNLGNIPAAWAGKAREITLPSDPDCGSPFVRGGAICHSVILQYMTDPDVLTYLDVEVTFCCSDGIVTKEIGMVDPDSITVPSHQLENEPIGDEFINGAMEDDDGNIYPNDIALEVGEEVILTVTLEAGSDFAGIILYAFFAFGADIFEDPGLTLYDIGCWVSPNLWKITHASDRQSVELEASVVKFLGEPRLVYVVTVMTCVQRSGCEPFACSDRRKREATSPTVANSTKQQFTSRINVLEPDVESFCQSEPGAVSIGAVVTMATLALGLLIVSGVLVACMVTTRRKNDPKA